MLIHSLDKFQRNVQPDSFNKHKTITIHQFPSGVEVFLDEGAETCQDGALYVETERTVRGEGDREQSAERAARRAKTQVRRRCKVIQADCMITLVYRENMTDEKRLQADFKAFRARIATLGEFQYVAVMEKQKRGALHLHIACQQFPAYLKNEHGVRVKSYNLLRSMWRRVVGADNGNVDVTKPRGRNSAHRIASYIAKYVSKSLEGAVFNSKSYWSSRGIVMPKPVKLYFDRDTETWEIVRMLVCGFNLDGYTDLAHYASKVGEFHWFAASKP